MDATLEWTARGGFALVGCGVGIHEGGNSDGTHRGTEGRGAVGGRRAGPLQGEVSDNEGENK